MQVQKLSAAPARRNIHTLLLLAGLVSSPFALAQSASTATSDGTTVTVKMGYTTSPTWVRVYLDTDRNATTGYRGYNIGSSYLIENGRLYRYSGTNGAWGWTFVKTVSSVASNGVATVQVARADIGSPTAANVVTQSEAPVRVSPVLALTTSTTTSPTGWTQCAVEWGTCSFNGTSQVRYGIPTRYVTKTLTGPVKCTNAVFGDPAPSNTKYCWIPSTSSGPAPAPSPTPTPEPSPTPTPTPTPTPEPTPEPSPTPTPSPAPGASVTVNYNPSAATIANPERGLYRHVGCETPLSQTQLTNFRTADGETLMLCVFYLRNFVNSPISSTTLNLFQQQMDTVRKAGLKAIVRFAYADANNPNDAKPAMVNTHLTQLQPYLAANKDVIAVVQAGLIGAWGEWGNTANYGDSYNMTAQNMADRKAVVDKLLAVVPAERMVQLRMPLFKMKLYSPTALTSSEAFTGTAKARLGHHNDCFLSNGSDYGTYVNPSVEYPYLAAETNFTVAGGETCAYVPPRSDCPTAISEMSKFHWSYLNLDYNTTVLNAWRSKGCFTEVEQKLGYRFVMKTGSFSSTAKPGGAFAVNLSIQNTGWAAPFNSRNVELVFRNTATNALYRVKLNADPRRWQAGQTVAINQTVTLPSTMPKGSYALLLNLPDPQASLSARPEYSIQLANTSTWEASTGFNNLQHTVGVAP